MLHNLLTFTGSQKSLSQHTQVQQHHINITAWPSAALAPALGTARAASRTAYPAPSICQTERAPGARCTNTAPLPKQASLCAQLLCCWCKPTVGLRAHRRAMHLSFSWGHLLQAQRRARTAKFKATGLSVLRSTHDAIFKTAPLSQKFVRDNRQPNWEQINRIKATYAFLSTHGTTELVARFKLELKMEIQRCTAGRNCMLYL